MKRTHVLPTLLLTLATAATGTLAGTTTAAADAGGRPASYLLQGDADSPVGSKFEGIGADERRGVFYVSEVTGGEIHRGTAQSATTEEWLAGDGTDGRFTARGITVDDAGNVYVAGGPNGIGTGRPDLWVYDRHGELLAALCVPGTTDAFLNDVTIGPDGAAYFTNSNDPQLFRVARGAHGWEVTLWADASGTITREEGFNLGGIVLTADRSAFVVAQGSAGRMWRFDVRTAAVRELATGTDLVNADGLVRQGNRLTVVRNFSKAVATLRVSADGRSLVALDQQATAADRVLTTAATLRGRVLYVDSKFDEAVASGPYEVVTDPTR
ncbi:Cu-Zn family superoxide dismutase [Nocardioides sp. J9]|uniref:SMP-30/gluconolactonase/LRE family protein n=1 Tax=Nocardioides sp. J9 TaxID=935844 RepID=UPI0011A35574|nr:SMP-30/gluconolactonase/LRE family protein [Nocardioides sp. J9]TWG92603.1 Cu-Zn family superoxide dismutase [Nocardioides sp. J9]